MRKTQKIAIVGGTVGVLMAGGIAFAAWTSTGSDTGTVTAGHQVNLFVDADEAATDLQPTLTKQVSINVRNDNQYPVELDSIVFQPGSSSVSGGLGPACSLSDVIVHPISTAADRLAPNGDVTYQADVEMIANANSDCQDAVFNLNFKATAHSVA
jgi:hypothetical protein